MQTYQGFAYMTEDTETYYRRRWMEETAAAEQATDENAANVHRSLAARYAVLSGEPQVRSMDEEQRPNITYIQRLSSAG